MLPSCSRSKNFAKGVLDHIVGRFKSIAFQTVGHKDSTFKCFKSLLLHFSLMQSIRIVLVGYYIFYAVLIVVFIVGSGVNGLAAV